MTTDEKLDAILAKCRDNITLAEGMIPRAAGVYLADLKYSLAGWRSTIAAVEGLREVASKEQATIDVFEVWYGYKPSESTPAMNALSAIVAAWEGLV